MPLTLKITLHDNGQMSVDGPIDNMFQCYGLLETAKDALRERIRQQNISQPSPADLMALGSVGRKS